MGQSVQIVGKRVLRPGIVRFEINRSLTSTAHSNYSGISDVKGDRPADLLASRLFAIGTVEGVHVFSNMITVKTSGAADVQNIDEIEEVLHDLFIHYRPGVMPTPV